MCDDVEFFQRRVEACEHVRDFFYDSRNSWKHAVTNILNAIRTRQRPLENRLPLLPNAEMATDATFNQSARVGARV
jgi:hypothetical protein